MDYERFIDGKRFLDPLTGIEPDAVNGKLFPFQSDIVRWALRRGRAAIFADCGMGKTAMQLEWARQVPGRVLIAAPLAVSTQTVREGKKFGIDVSYCTEDNGERIVVTNYERLDNFNPAEFHGIVLDESSILKNYTGKFRNYLIDAWGGLPFRLAATATPAPNDHMELGNHAEFLGTMTRTEMLAHFFVHDGGETQSWRLKGHAGTEFWKWLASWAVMIRKPSDLGYDDGSFTLPPLNIHQHTIESGQQMEGFLFAVEALTLQERQQARKQTTPARVAACAEIVNATDQPFLVWCNLNDESDMLAKSIPGAIEVKGSDTQSQKEERLMGFSEGRYRVLVTKPSIAGFGMNWQHCPNMAFVGLSDSYEQFYQAVRRCWRFGQDKPVHAHIITADIEGAVVKNIERKEADALRMAEEMVQHMHAITEQNIKGSHRMDRTYEATKTITVPNFLTA
jgi:superfamily II DNA or RNA helicase